MAHPHNLQPFHSNPHTVKAIFYAKLGVESQRLFGLALDRAGWGRQLIRSNDKVRVWHWNTTSESVVAVPGDVVFDEGGQLKTLNHGQFHGQYTAGYAPVWDD